MWEASQAMVGPLLDKRRATRCDAESHVVTRKLGSRELPSHPLLTRLHLNCDCALSVSKLSQRTRNPRTQFGCAGAQGVKRQLRPTKHEDMAMLWGVLGGPQSLWKIEETGSCRSAIVCCTTRRRHEDAVCPTKDIPSMNDGHDAILWRTSRGYSHERTQVS